jgi:hypothetical protein
MLLDTNTVISQTPPSAFPEVDTPAPAQPSPVATVLNVATLHAIH